MYEERWTLGQHVWAIEQRLAHIEDQIKKLQQNKAAIDEILAWVREQRSKEADIEEDHN